MNIQFTGFLGTAPKYDDEQVPDGYSVVSHNTKSERSILEPWALPQPVGTVSWQSAASIFKYNSKWFSWPTLTYAVRAPLKNDPYDFVVIASDGSDPQVAYNLNAESGSTYPAVTYPLNVPKPASIISVSVDTAANWHQEPTVKEDGTEEVIPIEGQSAATEDLNGDGVIGIMPYEEPEEVEYDVSEVAYAYCYVDAWGRLSQLSSPSDLVEIKEYQYTNTTATKLVLPDLPEGLLATDPIRGTSAKIRIFRTNTSRNGTSVYQFVDEIPATETEYTDTTFSGDLLDAPLNADWVGAPNLDTELYPNGPMQKIAIMGADILVGHNKRLLCFAEPDAFYAWPVKYYKVFQEDIVTIQPAGANLVVLTTGVPYVVQGVHPDSMDATRLSEPVPCSSPRGVTEVAGAVYFTSDTGLHRLENYSVANVSDGFLTNKQWRDLDTSSLILANYDNKVFVHSPTTGKTLVFDALDAKAGVRTLDINATCFAQMEETNDLAFVEKGTNTLVKFDSADAGWLEVEWESKTYLFNDPTSFNIAKVRANSYPVRVTVAYDHANTGEERGFTKDVNDSSFFYLPFNARAHRWRVKVGAVSQATKLEVRDIQLAQSPEELI